MTEWRWVAEQTILAIHDEQLAQHGGLPGMRDPGMLASALARPLNLAAYGDPDTFELAAAYAFGIMHNHPFVDGNKRTAFVASAVFLMDNGYELDASEQEATLAMYAMAERQMAEKEFAAWLRGNCIPFEGDG
jgi:death on curing protein